MQYYLIDLSAMKYLLKNIPGGNSSRQYACNSMETAI